MFYAFGSYQQLANKYNSIIIRVYGAAGHGRGLIDAMSSFGVKGILRRSIIGKDIFFADSNEIKEYLESIGDERMLYRVVDETELYPAKQHLVENQIKIKPCQKMHLFVYEPGKEKPIVREYLCSCDMCLDMKFEECINNLEAANINVETEELHDDIEVTEDEHIDDPKAYLFDFIETPSYVTVLFASSAHESFYLCKIVKKAIAADDMEDRYGHKVFKDEKYLEGLYLEKVRIKESRVIYKLLEKHVVFLRIQVKYIKCLLI